MLSQIRNLKYIIFTKNFPLNRVQVALTYLRLVCNSIYHHKVSRKRPTVLSERILGFEINFFTYGELINLFEEIFIYNVYYTKDECTEVLDCGSNIGLSVLYFKIRYPECRIVGFEPHPDTFDLLKSNVHQNKLQGIVLYKHALANKIATGHLFAGVRNSLNYSLCPNEQPGESLEVSIRKLSSFIEGQISILKLDVEGSEIDVIEELVSSNSIHKIRRMIIEFHNTERDPSLLTLASTLRKNNFSCDIQKSPFENAPELMLYCNNLRDY